MSLFNKTVVVTGGAGFVGSNVVSHCLDRRAKVVVLDNFFTGSLENLDVKDKNLEVVNGSVADRDLVMGVVKYATFVVHCAVRNISASVTDPVADLETNIAGTLNVLLAAQQHDVKSVVYTSSASVYGGSSKIPFSEIDSVNLMTPYSVSKFSGEHYCALFYNRYKLPITTLRLSNVYGRRQTISNPYCGVVAKFIEAAIKGEPLTVLGDGSQTRDFTYIDDVVEAVAIVMTSPESTGDVFNIGTGVETRVVDLAKAVISTCASSSKIVYGELRAIDNVHRRSVSSSRFRSVFDWTTTDLSVGLEKTKTWRLGR